MFGKDSGLSLDQAPPFTIPLRFFLTAPFFGIVAGVFILLYVSSLGTRSALEVVALTHFFTIGFLAMTMIGAMFQMLPVTAGVRFEHQNIIATILHAMLLIGVLTFGYAIYSYDTTMISIATILLILAFLIFIVSTTITLRKAKNITPTIKAFIVALLSLFIALILALLISASHINSSFLNIHQGLLYTHIVFSLIGWVGVLIIGVSFQVVPMFYVADDYPSLYTKHAVKVALISMLGLGFALINGNMSLFLLFKIMIAVLLIDYAVTTIGILFTRKRKITDTTTYYWYLSMAMLIASVVLSLANEFINNSVLNTVVVVVFIYGFAISVITGMMYKIVPFLVWFHLNSQGYMNMPTMNELIGKRLTLIQFFLHVFSIASLIGFVFFELQLITGVLIVLSNSFVLYNLIKGSRIYFTKSGLEKIEF